MDGAIERSIQICKESLAQVLYPAIAIKAKSKKGTAINFAQIHYLSLLFVKLRQFHEQFSEKTSYK